MDHDELVRKMVGAFAEAGGNQMVSYEYQAKCMAAALKVCVDALLAEPSEEEGKASYKESCIKDSCFNRAAWIISQRRSRYLPKSDPAVEIAGRVLMAELKNFDCKTGQVVADVAEKIVAAVRKADALRGC